MKIQGVVVINLTRLRLSGRDAVSTANAAMWSVLSETPAGADLRLIVPAWDWWSPFAADALLGELGEDLGTITVESSDPMTVREWVLALRRGSRHLQAVSGG